MKMKNLIGYDIDDVLDLVGLARRRSLIEAVLPAMGFVVLGAAIGAGVGLMLAPSSGRRLRQEVGDRLDQVKSRVMSAAEKQGLVDARQQQQQQG